METGAHSVFISYASPDRDRVLPFFERLEKRGFNVWIDCRRIRAGQNWNFEIKRALDKAAIVILFLSRQSVDRRGYVQREQKICLDKMAEKLIDDIYIIPVLLDDDVAVPDQLKTIQHIRATDPSCDEEIATSVAHQLERLGVEVKRIQEGGHLRWSSRIVREEFDGIPGYEVELAFIDFYSDRYKGVAEIGDYIKGYLLPSLFRHRASKFLPEPSMFNYGQEKFPRTNTYDAHHGSPVIAGKIVTVQYAIDWYGAGAAHPNHDALTFSFLLDPVILIDSLENIFQIPSLALAAVQSMSRSQLYNALTPGDRENQADKSSIEKIDRGTQDWEYFRAFIFEDKCITVMFPPYQVAAYAYGFQSVELPYQALAPFDAA